MVRSVSTLALYRTYRPGQFSQLVGQDHVTEPLIRALENNRVHHAYLFSGPRGCGKTSSARILARSLNCENGPTPQPCGECQSCRDLAPNGAGSIDVVELDAATHGLVDDARDLREKAHFAPVSSRFKVYIIDEAHQLGPGAANALLKLIEEPPPHLKFIFATTAPDKIIGTIRSRTFHYPFRLIPSKVLQKNLGWICEQEGVEIEPAALALVARAGAGSARDAQSVLGQLIAGSGDDGVTYELAVSLLGFTDASLLDEVIGGIATGDSAAVFDALDRVIESGHEPRRFLTDLLERFRDLIVVRSAPDAVTSGLLDVPDERASHMTNQASQFGPHDLVRLANVVDEGITAMKGATPTRLQLELVSARLLLPGADHDAEGLQARLDRLERRIAGTGSAATAAPSSTSASPRPQPTAETHAETAAHTHQQAPPEPTARAGETTRAKKAPEPQATAPQTSTSRAPSTPTEPTAAPPSASSGGATSLADLRKMWDDVLSRLREIKLTAWSLIAQNSVVADLSDDAVVMAFRQPTLRDTFARRDDLQGYLRQAIKDVMLVDLRVEAIVDPSVASPGASSSAAAASQASIPATSPKSSTSVAPVSKQTPPPVPTEPESEHSMDDADADDSGMSERDLVARTLGATVIEEQSNDA